MACKNIGDDLNEPDRCDEPTWMQIVAMRRRKTLVVCRRFYID
jgi:hypothetical protein